MTRKTLLRLTTPAILLSAWMVSHHVRQAYLPGIAWALLLTAMIAACLQRPFRAERLPARALVLLLFWPARMTEAMIARVGSCDRLETMFCLATILILVVAVRFVLIWRRLPEGRNRAVVAFDALSPKGAKIARAELALLRFGLFRWRRRDADRPASAVAFPATGTGVELAMCWLTASGLVIETPLFHVLVAHVWNMTAAWASTGLHAVLGLYLIGYAKSLSFRPTLLFPDRLEIRLGAVARRIVPLAAIDHVSSCGIGKQRQPDEQRLFGFDEPNLRLSTQGSYILFRVDEPACLVAALAVPS